MEIMLKFLIVYLNSFDCNRNSIKFLRDQKFIDCKTSSYHMMERIYFGYKLMKFRMKISFEACKKFRTIQEHILYAILEVYYERANKGLIEDPYPKPEPSFLDSLINSNLVDIQKS